MNHAAGTPPYAIIDNAGSRHEVHRAVCLRCEPHLGPWRGGAFTPAFLQSSAPSWLLLLPLFYPSFLASPSSPSSPFLSLFLPLSFSPFVFAFCLSLLLFFNLSFSIFTYLSSSFLMLFLILCLYLHFCLCV